jgi:HSP20 family molecular chaperone IbpA
MFLKSLFRRAAEHKKKRGAALAPFHARKDMKLADLRSWADITAMAGGELGAILKAPKFEISETERGVELEIVLPGVDGNGVNIQLEGGMLTLKAESARNQSDQGGNTQRVAQVSRSYEHRIQLPFEAGEGAQAVLSEEGRLKIFVPRSKGAASASEKITVRNA